MKYHVQKKELPSVEKSFMVVAQPIRTVFVVIDADGQESWECITQESADLRCAALNYDESCGGRNAEVLVCDFLSVDEAQPSKQ